MLNPLDRTYDYLATTENGAADAVLMAAIDHADAAVAEGALRAILRRKSPVALLELVQRWHCLGDRWKQIVAEWPGVLTDSLKACFHSDNEQLIRNASDAAVAVVDFDFFSTFTAALKEDHPLRVKLAALGTLQFAEALYDELHGHPRSNLRRDAQTLRRYVMGCLEEPATNYHQHKCDEVLEAFLLLAPRENVTLRHILQDSRDSAHEPLCEQLQRSTRPGVIRLLLSLLDDAHAPVAGLRILGRRCDLGFFQQLAHKLVDDHSPNLPTNLARIDQFAWIENQLSIVDSLEEDFQPGVVMLIWKSKLTTSLKRRALQHMLKVGAPRGRQAAARALLHVLGPEGDMLLTRLLHDESPLVQAEAVRQLRPRDIPNALSTLIDLLESPYGVVRAAAQESLQEFTFVRYLSTFDALTPDVRKSTGEIVMRANPNLTEELVTELIAHGRPRRMRAMQIANVLGVVQEMEFGLIELCNDEDRSVRLEAARMLGQCPSQEARRTLRELLTDASTAVQHMAEQSLQDMLLIEPDASTLFGGKWFDDTRNEVTL